MDSIGFVDFEPRCSWKLFLGLLAFPWMMLWEYVTEATQFCIKLVREKPYWLKLALAIFGICLYSADIGTDIFVGVDLIQRCHNRFAAAVLTFTIMPGFVFVFLLICEEGFKPGCSWKLFLVLLAPLGGALGGILFIPGGLVVLILSAIKLDSSEWADGAKKAKLNEMMLESFPQWILNLFIIQGLPVYETLNIVSTCISAFSVVYGLGEWLAFNAHSEELDYPLHKTLWGMLTIVVDNAERNLLGICYDHTKSVYAIDPYSLFDCNSDHYLNSEEKQNS